MWRFALLFFASAQTFQQLYFPAYIDNYGYTGETFNLRYFLSTDFANSSVASPLLFYTGNEGDVEVYVNNTGFMIEIAQNVSAIVVFAEHRYYGKSLPFSGNLTTSQLKYFSPHQALADYAYLLSHLEATYNISQVIAFGGSYGGMLASWIRIKYPHFVDGALASSAPDLHFQLITDPETFAQIVTLAFALQSSSCTEAIKAGFSALTDFVLDDDHYYILDQTFKTCEITTSYEEAELILEWAVDGLAGLATLNYPYAANYTTPLPTWPVEFACNLIDDLNPQTPQSALEALYTAAEVYYNFTGQLQCNDMTPDLIYGLGWLWSYVRCTTLVMPIGFSGEDDMFYSRPWDLIEFLDFCEARFGPIKPQVRSPMIMYGSTNVTSGLFLYLSQVIFSNGEIDPWQSGGVFGNVNKEVETIYIQNSAHHLDLRGSNPADFEAIQVARAQELEIIQNWLGVEEQSPSDTQ